MEPQNQSPQPAPQDQPTVVPAPEQPTMAPESPMQQTVTPQPTMQPMPTATAPVAAAPVNPGHGMGIAGLVCAFLVPLLGLILSIIAKGKSKKAGMGNGLALAGIIIGAFNTVVGTIVIVLFIMGLGAVSDCVDEINAAAQAGRSSSTVVCE